MYACIISHTHRHTYTQTRKHKQSKLTSYQVLVKDDGSLSPACDDGNCLDRISFLSDSSDCFFPGSAGANATSTTTGRSVLYLPSSSFRAVYDPRLGSSLPSGTKLAHRFTAKATIVSPSATARAITNQHSVLLLVRGLRTEMVEIERIVLGSLQPSAVFPTSEELLLRVIDETGTELVPGVFRGTMQDYGIDSGLQGEPVVEDLNRTIEWTLTRSDGVVVEVDTIGIMTEGDIEFSAWAGNTSDSRLHLPSGALMPGMNYTLSAMVTVRPVKVATPLVLCFHLASPPYRSRWLLFSHRYPCQYYAFIVIFFHLPTPSSP